MYIKQITLRDWKSFTSATFDFPSPEEHKNISIVGAPNGYGKTSLFEAILLGMFGRDGMTLVARSPLAPDEKDRLATSYRKFLEKALHYGATKAGRTSCSVKLVFIDDEEEPLEIKRIWHFSDSGTFRVPDEEVHIFQGSTRRAVGPPRSVLDTERMDWYREFIAEHLLSFTLAYFFMFDGEQVSVLAEREMSAQVRTGIEGLLGIPILRMLAKDLRSYAEARRRETPSISDDSIKKIEAERRKNANELEMKEKHLKEIEPDRASLEKEREELIRELAGFGAGSQALLQDLFEQIKDYERLIDAANAQLEALLLGDLALSLPGANLRARVKKQLISESIRDKWEGGKNQGNENLERYIQHLIHGISEIEPTLSKIQSEHVADVARNAWEKLWFPPPKNCASEFHHLYLNEMERSKVIDRIDQLGALGEQGIVELLNSITDNSQALKQVQNEVGRTEAIAPHVDSKRERLVQINLKIQDLDSEIGAVEREINALQSLTSQANKKLQLLSGQLNQSEPSTRRATRADEVAAMIDNIVEEAVPSQIGAIASAMTSAHRSMSHKKGLVERITIDQNCNVKLLNSEGLDIRGYDLSAGEKQIFTQALISAVSSVSGRVFPMVVDTPLGRLDIEHRKGVLRHLAKRGHQVILLSTNTEVVGEYLNEISPHVQKRYIIDFEKIGDIGQSSVRHGYFQN